MLTVETINNTIFTMTTPSIKLINGNRLPVVGLGTWQSDDEKELETSLDAALENGYRHIDTAFAYKNEHVIGNVLQKWFDTGKLKREDIFITTKLPIEAIQPNRVEPHITESLRNLKLDYIDLYLIHFPVSISSRALDSKDPIKPEPTDHVAVWKKMEEQVDTGRTKTIGISNFNIHQTDRILKNSRIKPASLQIENHIFLPQNELVKFAQDNGIVVVAYSPLANPGINTFFTKFGLPLKELPSIFTNTKVKSIADKYKKTPAQVALKYLLQRNIAVIPKSVTVNRIKENIDLFNFTLDAQDMAALRGLEIGEAARVCDFKFLPVLVDHPEYPFPKE